MFNDPQLGANIVPVLGILAGCGVAVVWIIAAYYRSVQVADMDATLKLEMIQRGMNADEIERVLQAKSEHVADHGCSHKRKVASVGS